MSAARTRCARILTDDGYSQGGEPISEWDIRGNIPELLALLERCGVLRPGDRGPSWALTEPGRLFVRKVLQA